MWVIFLLSAMAFAILSISVVWLSNKVFLLIKKDNDKYSDERNGKNNEN